jgi:hypothetical protein
MTKKYILYFDDTGTRDPDKTSFQELSTPRRDGMDCFGLGGIIIKEEDIDGILQKHRDFCGEWNIDYPLHSSRIRGRQGKFGWLKKSGNEELFLPAIEEFLLSLPIISIACVIDRCGYVDRYKTRHDRLWFMCKTAFCILVERTAKFVEGNGRKLEIFFEKSGKNEDRKIVQYLKDLKQQGNPFTPKTSGEYSPLTSEDYRRIILGDPRGKTKNVPMLQIADLVLYPIAKGAYDSHYRPYNKLREAGKLIDVCFSKDQVPFLGIKYSCFDNKK